MFRLQKELLQLSIVVSVMFGDIHVAGISNYFNRMLSGLYSHPSRCSRARWQASRDTPEEQRKRDRSHLTTMKRTFCVVRNGLHGY